MSDHVSVARSYIEPPFFISTARAVPVHALAVPGNETWFCAIGRHESVAGLYAAPSPMKKLPSRPPHTRYSVPVHTAAESSRGLNGDGATAVHVPDVGDGVG